MWNDVVFASISRYWCLVISSATMDDELLMSRDDISKDNFILTVLCGCGGFPFFCNPPWADVFRFWMVNYRPKTIMVQNVMIGHLKASLLSLIVATSCPKPTKELVTQVYSDWKLGSWGVSVCIPGNQDEQPLVVWVVSWERTGLC